MLRTAALALASCLLSAQARPQVALFQAQGFPAADSPEVTPEVLTRALQGLRTELCPTLEALTATLAAGPDLLVLPYGSAFPLDAWEAIRAHLERGGSLVVLGGAPFHQPVLRKGDQWVLGQRQPTFAHALLIGPAEEVPAAGLRVTPVAASSWTLALPSPSRTWALTVRFGMKKEALAEEAPDAPRDAVLRPLVHLSDGRNPVGCAAQEIDRLRGTFAGGRWVLATSDAALDASQIRALVDRALQGPTELEALPVQACVEPGDTPRMRVFVHRPKGGGPTQASLRLLDDQGRERLRTTVGLAGPATTRFAEVPLATPKPLAPGLYRVEVSLPGESRQPGTLTSGFWVRDGRLLAGTPPLTASGDWLRRNGKPVPVVGTTYMASDVHRRFLLQPNPALWDQDFARMKAEGVNLVRTGLWAYWNRLQTGPSSLDDQALRALDAFVHTAARHGIDVCFTFFAFLPPAYGAEHPYLDPKAFESQAALAAQVARRYRGVGRVHYDLINEPSYATPESLWTNRPLGDRFEREAWHRWLKVRVADTTPQLRDLWRDDSEDVWGVPRLEELVPAAVKDGKRPRKVRDFRRFSHEVVAGWAARLRTVIRDAAGDVLVTVGQDEAGLNLNPSTQVMAAGLDYTALHNWWLNDDLLWDTLGAKVPGKPLLVNETGMMRLEDLDGRPWRSPEESARLLERKVALAFAGRAGGIVEWTWAINPYMALDNESIIGIVRPDGTVKPEVRALRHLAAFLAQATPHLEDFKPDPIVVVLPHGRMLMGRPFPLEGTQRLVRLLGERFALAPATLSEFLLSPEHLKGAKLIIVPTPEQLEPAASEALAKAAEAGALVVVTGHLEGDPYGRPLPGFGGDPGQPLAFREGTASFPGQLNEKLRKGTRSGREGRIWWEPLPVELAREEGPLVTLLEQALAAAGIQPPTTGSGPLTRVLETPTHALVIAVNEGAQEASRHLTLAGHPLRLVLPAGGSRMVLVEKATGKVVAER